MATAPIKSPKISRISVRQWLQGTVTALDDGRTPTDGLKSSQNMILDQDGTLRPRPALIPYGPVSPGTILGEVFEFVKPNGTINETWLCAMIAVAGVGYLYVQKDGGAWQQCTGKTYSATAAAHFAQIDNRVLIMNGFDNLSFLTLNSTSAPPLTITPFVALGAMTNPGAVVSAGLMGTNYSYYYQITASSTFGETAASSQTKVDVTAPRDQWTPSTQSVQLAWSAPTNASSSTTYNVYLASTQTGTAFLIASGINGLQFKDDGSKAVNVQVQAPLADTTAGPKPTRASVVNGQVFVYGDPNSPRTIYYGGTAGSSKLNFSPFNGGGNLEIGRGTKEIPVRIMAFRDGRGVAQITVLCRGTNGLGKRYLMTPATQTIGTTIINYFAVTEDNGTAGTDSPDGVVLYNDALWYPSRDGFKTTGTKPQLQNILSSESVSNTIINDVKNLNNAAMDKCVGLAYQQRLYWCVPNGTTANNEIWVLDLARNGAWMKPWDIAASWMFLYNSNDGLTHHLVVSGNRVYELATGQGLNDDGKVFTAAGQSGTIKFSEDFLEWASVIDVTFVLLRPTGTITFTVNGKTEEASNATLASGQFVNPATTQVVGWGEAGWGGSPDRPKPQIYGWSNFGTIPLKFANAQELYTLEVSEELEWLSYGFYANTAGTDFSLADVIVRYVNIGVKDLT